MRLLVSLLLGCTACYTPPDFPPLEDWPLVAKPASDCGLGREGYVSCVIDGDTLAIADCDETVGERVRLLGIDAPEIAHDEDPAECYGPEAKAYVDDILRGRYVGLTFTTYEEGACEDAYSRTLAWVWILPAEYDDDEWDQWFENEDRDEELLLNEWLLWEGWARRYPEFPTERDELLDGAELAAQVAGRGLWGACTDDEG